MKITTHSNRDGSRYYLGEYRQSNGRLSLAENETIGGLLTDVVRDLQKHGESECAREILKAPLFGMLEAGVGRASSSQGPETGVNLIGSSSRRAVPSSSSSSKRQGNAQRNSSSAGSAF